MKNIEIASPSDEVHRVASKLARVGKSSIGVFLCIATALALTLASHYVHATESLPLFFLVIVGVVARYFGTPSAMAGLVTAAIVFAVSFPPVGHLSIGDQGARTNLVLMLLFGLAVAYFYGTESSDDDSNRQNS